jgi:hypothetical protein
LCTNLEIVCWPVDFSGTPRKGNHRHWLECATITLVGLGAVSSIDGVKKRVKQVVSILPDNLVVDRALRVDEGNANLEVKIGFTTSM